MEVCKRIFFIQNQICFDITPHRIKRQRKAEKNNKNGISEEKRDTRNCQVTKFLYMSFSLLSTFAILAMTIKGHTMFCL